MTRMLCWMAMALLTGCVSLRATNCASLHPRVRYCLQSAEVVGDFAVLQRVDLTWNQRKETALVELETEVSDLTMAVLTPMGQKLMQFKYAPPTMIPMGAVSNQVDPVLMAALVQLSIWPASSVSEGLSGQFEWKVGPNQRRLSVGGQTVLDISYVGVLPDPDSIQVHLPLQQLDMHIQSLRDISKP